MKKVLSVFLALMCLLLAAAPALAINVVQNPGYYASDFASVLSGEVKNHIEVNAKALDNATGAQIVFVTLRTVQPYTTEDYANALFNNWKIGDATKNNGVLVLLAISDQDYFVQQGTGLERNLPSSELSNIVNDDLEPDFANGNYSAASTKTFDALFEKLVKIYGLNLALDTTTKGSYYGAGGSTSNSGGSNNYSSDNSYGNDGSASQGGDNLFSPGNILIAIGIVVVVLSLFSGARSGCGCLPAMFGGWLGGMMSGGRRRPPGPWDGGFGGPRPGGFGGGGFSGGGGSSRGSGVGRRRGGGGGFGGGGFGGGGFGGGFGGGGFSGGGGGSRGSGVGRGR